jgi:hypothetical protein
MPNCAKNGDLVSTERTSKAPSYLTIYFDIKAIFASSASLVYCTKQCGDDR